MPRQGCTKKIDLPDDRCGCRYGASVGDGNSGGSRAPSDRPGTDPGRMIVARRPRPVLKPLHVLRVGYVAGLSREASWAAMSKVTRLNEARRAYVLGTIRSDIRSGDRELKARHYRLRAEELRVISEEVLLRETSRTLLSLAESYDQMAEMVESGFGTAADYGGSESA